jgi:hypothetical protein
MIDQKEGEAELTVLVNQDEMVNCSSSTSEFVDLSFFFAEASSLKKAKVLLQGY